MSRSLPLVLLGFSVLLFTSSMNAVAPLAHIVADRSSTYDNPVDDFYVTDGTSSLLMSVAENDGNTPGWFWLQQTEPIHHGFLANQGTFYQFFSYAPLSGFNGFDYFRYRYQTGAGSYTNEANVYILVIQSDDATNAGRTSCETGGSVGKPVNVTNGNMWISERDYQLSGLGESIVIDRFYNSLLPTNGLFGNGWSTAYDESLFIYSDDQMIRLNAPDGRASYFGRPAATGAFAPFSKGVVAQIIKNVDLTYDLIYKDGRVHKFSSTGRLLWLSDRNGNHTTLTYDGSGVLSIITDPTGRTLSISRGSNGNVSQLTDSMGTVATYDYFTGTHDLQTVTFPDGSKYKFEYSSGGKIETVKDALNNVLETHQYDTSGRAITSAKHGGVELLTIDYDQYDSTYGAYTKVTDALGRVTKYFFTKIYGTNLVTRAEGVCGCGGSGSEVTQYSYDTNNSWLNLVKKTDALGHDTLYTYDSDRNITSMQDVLGTQSYTYNSFGEVLTATDRMSGVTTNTYDTTGNLLTTTAPLSHTTTLTYTAEGQLETITDARSKTTTITYNTNGLVSQVTDANGKVTDLTYNDRGQVDTITNALSETTQFDYDDNNRLNKVTFPDSNEINIGYDLAGRRTSVTDENANETTFAYDDAYRLTSKTDVLSHTMSYGYDDMSNLTSMTDALGNVTDLEYDDFNRLKKIIYPLPSPSATPRLQESFTYDQRGDMLTHVDTAGHTTSYEYDSIRRMKKITDALSHETNFTYNDRSQLTKIKDALNQEYDFTYDPLGRELSETRAGTMMSFGYDAVGNRTSRTDHNGNGTTYTYDDLNRLTAIAYSGSSEYASYGYDDLSRVTSAQNQNGTVSFTYDNRGRLASETDVFGHVMGFAYDPAGNRTGLSIDSTSYAAYVYDEVNRLKELNVVAESNGFGFKYDNADRLISDPADPFGPVQHVVRRTVLVQFGEPDQSDGRFVGNT